MKKSSSGVKRLSKNEEAQRLYEAREKVLWDESARTKKTAVNKNSREIAINFLKMGLSVEQIAKGTGLPIPEIEKLYKEKSN